MLTLGVYMAYETRLVKIPALNDSQYIGFSVYGAVITSVSVVVLASLLSEQVCLWIQCKDLFWTTILNFSLFLIFVTNCVHLFHYFDFIIAKSDTLRFSSRCTDSNDFIPISIFINMMLTYVNVMILTCFIYQI